MYDYYYDSSKGTGSGDFDDADYLYLSKNITGNDPNSTGSARQAYKRNTGLDWSPIDTFAVDGKTIQEDSFSDQLKIFDTKVDEYTHIMNQTECQRYLKVKLTVEIRKRKANGDSTDFVEVFYNKLNEYDANIPDMTLFGNFYAMEDLPGKTSKPVSVDTVVQIQSINEINLNGEYMDATIALSMRWTDDRLSWNADYFGGVKKIRALKEQLWIPDLNIVNRIHDFSPEDEKTPKRKIFDYTDHNYTCFQFKFKTAEM